MKTTNHLSLRAGLSLFELLMTICILGVLCTLSLAWFGGDGSKVQQARDQRNAQTICSLCQAADAAGMNLALEATTALEVARRLSEGVTISKGVLKGRTFKLPGLGGEELSGAARFLRVQEGQILYVTTPSAEPGGTLAEGES